MNSSTAPCCSVCATAPKIRAFPGHIDAICRGDFAPWQGGWRRPCRGHGRAGRRSDGAKAPGPKGSLSADARCGARLDRIPDALFGARLPDRLPESEQIAPIWSGNALTADQFLQKTRQIVGDKIDMGRRVVVLLPVLAMVFGAFLRGAPARSACRRRGEPRDCGRCPRTWRRAPDRSRGARKISDRSQDAAWADNRRARWRTCLRTDGRCRAVSRWPAHGRANRW